MSGPSPQETWRRLNQGLQQAQRRFGQGGGGPNPRGALGGAAGLLLLGGGAWLFTNALYNGISDSRCNKRRADSTQSMVGTVLSSIRG